jgi:hypothetical protein
MLVKIIERAREVGAQSPSRVLNIFLNNEYDVTKMKGHLDDFCSLDDYDILFSIKTWMRHPDTILSLLCKSLINRHLLKVAYSAHRIDQKLLEEKTQLAMNHYHINKEEASYLVFTGESEIKTYDNKTEHINILFKNGSVKDISEVDNPLINQSLFTTVKKFYICFDNTQITV